MKRMTLPLLLLCLLLWGCGSSGKESIEFYYLRTSYVYGSEDGVIAAETREHSGSLEYLLSLYLRGPLDDGLKSPFPAGCEILEIRQERRSLRLTLDQSLGQLKDLDRTLACACLARTCFGLTDVQEVRITSGGPEGSSFSITISRDSLILEDSSSLPAQTDPVESQ